MQPALVAKEGVEASAEEVNLSRSNIAKTFACVKTVDLRMSERYYHSFPVNPPHAFPVNLARLQLPLIHHPPHAPGGETGGGFTGGNGHSPGRGGEAQDGRDHLPVAVSVGSKLQKSRGEKHGMARLCKYHRGLNVLLESNRDGLGDLASMFDNVRGTTRSV